MGMFIQIELDRTVKWPAAVARQLVEVCPVDIFELARDGKVRTIEANEDECTLCELCLPIAPQGSLRVVTLYDGEVLGAAHR